MFGLPFILLVIALALIYFYVKLYLYSYWQRRGIPYLRPSFPFGNYSKTFLKKWPLGVQSAELYRSTSERFIGIFMLQTPMLLIRDANLIRRILITDFQHFADRDFYLNEEKEPMSAHLGALRGQNWQDMRAKLRPAFIPNKMKSIFSDLLNCGHQLQNRLTSMVNSNEDIEICEIAACYASNIVASAALGIDIDCFNNPNHPFREMGRRLFAVNIKNGLRFIGLLFQPALLKWLRLRFVDRDVDKYFMNLVTQIMEMRERENIVRDDFFQLLVENQKQNSLTIEQMAAQVFAVYFAGVESITLATSHCLFEIAKHSDVQQKIHAEIGHAMDQHNGQLTYESINELKYLDCCIEETSRKYQLFDLTRKCVKDYKIPRTDVIIERGTVVMIPAYALHHDEKFYPDPEKFDPTRFNSENKSGNSTIDRPFLPFGEGPRNCIGQKMGKMFTKIGICSILQQYYIDLDDRHSGKELKSSINLHPIGGYHLKLKAK